MLPSIVCIKCNKEKPKEKFYKIHTGYRIKTCTKCYSKISKERNKEIAKRKKRFKWF